MNLEHLKIILKGKDVTFLKSIIYKLYKKIPEAKEYLDISIPHEKEIVKQNIEGLLKRYKKQIDGYIFPIDFQTPTKEEEALRLIERIRKKEISPKFTIECELHYIDSCKHFILEYGYFDEEYYIAMDEMFESACKKIKKHHLIEFYQDRIKKLTAFGNEYGFQFEEIYNEIDI